MLFRSLPGNHDVFDNTNVYSRNRSAVDESGVAFFDATRGTTRDFGKGALRIWARAMEEHTPTYKPLAGSPEHPGDRWFIAAGHAHFSPTGSDEYRSSCISVEDINATAADYVALGHWHLTTNLTERGTSVPAWYCGSPMFGYGSANMLLVDFNSDATEEVCVRPISVLDHPASTCAHNAVSGHTRNN